MTKYLSEADASADDFHIVHEPEDHRFLLVRGTGEGRVRVGEAHYTLHGDAESGRIDFDHTYVDPQLRGSGLSGLLAQRALTDEIAEGRRIEASCSYIAGYLNRHPELRH